MHWYLGITYYKITVSKKIITKTLNLKPHAPTLGI